MNSHKFEGHNRHDYHCEHYLGHNAVPMSVDVYEERCILCDPYTEEAEAIINPPMITQCADRESGGVQCEVMLTSPDEEHNHWISDATIAQMLRRPFATFIRATGVTMIYR